MRTNEKGEITLDVRKLKLRISTKSDIVHTDNYNRENAFQTLEDFIALTTELAELISQRGFQKDDTITITFLRDTE